MGAGTRYLRAARFCWGCWLAARVARPRRRASTSSAMTATTTSCWSPLGRDEAPWRDAVYAESYYPRLHFGWSELKTLRSDRYKLIMSPQPELFDLQQRQPHRRPVQAARLAASKRVRLRSGRCSPTGSLYASQRCPVVPDLYAPLQGYRNRVVYRRQLAGESRGCPPHT